MKLSPVKWFPGEVVSVGESSEVDWTRAWSRAAQEVVSAVGRRGLDRLAGAVRRAWQHQEYFHTEFTLS